MLSPHQQYRGENQTFPPLDSILLLREQPDESNDGSGGSAIFWRNGKFIIGLLAASKKKSVLKFKTLYQLFFVVRKYFVYMNVAWMLSLPAPVGNNFLKSKYTPRL